MSDLTVGNITVKEEERTKVETWTRHGGSL